MLWAQITGNNITNELYHLTKPTNKQLQVKLAALIKKIHGDDVNLDALFDIHVSWGGQWV